MGESGWTGRTVTVSDEHILVKSDHDRHDEATILLELLPDKPCLIVPSTTSSGLEGGFELRYGLCTFSHFAVTSHVAIILHACCAES